MKNTFHKNKSHNKQVLNISALAAAISFAIALPVLGAEKKSTTEEIEVISVVGIQKNLTVAVAAKRDSSQFVDAISADDMGKLPDANVAESLQRVSGVQLERGIGEGSTISIRGLRQNVILVNGRQIHEGGGRGSTGPDTLESSSYSLLSLIPSSLVSKLEVSKQASSSQIEGALGGVVNIITRKPLDTSGQKFVTNLSGVYGDLSEDKGYEWSGLYSNTFNDDTLGFQLAGSVSSREFREDGLNTFSGYTLLSENDGLEDIDSDNNGVPGLVFRDMRFWQINDERKKTGLNAMVQWRPTDSLDLYVDSFYSEVTSDRNRYWTGFWNCCSFENPVFSKNDVLISATTNRPVQTNTEFADAKSSFLSTAIGGTWVGDVWTVSGELSISNSESKVKQDYIRYQTAKASKVTFDLTAGDVPALSFGDADLTAVDGLNVAIVFDNFTPTETSDAAFKLDFVRDIDSDFFTTFEFGGRYNQLETVGRKINRDVRPNFSLTDLPSISTLFSSPNFFSGEASAATREYLVVDENLWQGCKTLNEAYDATQLAECSEGYDETQGYNVDEDISAIYIKSNYESEIGDKAISGNIGVRYVSRDLTSTGSILDTLTGTASTYSVDVSDKEILPSVVMKIDWSEDVVFRVGAARTLTFPNAADLRSGINVKGDFTGFGGNPELNPFIINQADFSTEWYFGEASLLSAGLFFKDVESFIVNTIQPIELAGYSQPVVVAQKKNGESGTIQGLELLYQQPLSFLPEPFNGLGVQATYSYIDSETPTLDANGNNLPIPGLSENNINFVVYYETESFGARLAYNWRDEYLNALGASDTGIFNKSYDDLAATANWVVDENITLSFEATNILDTRQEQYNAYEEAIRRNVEFGRTYKMTVSMNF